MLTDQELRGSLYYPAAGTDLKPVLLLGDRLNIFVYADWNCSQGEVAQAFAKGAEASDSKLRFVDSQSVDLTSYLTGRLITVCRNSRSRNFRQGLPGDENGVEVTDVFPAGFDFTPAYADYDRLRRHAIGVREPWIKEFRFEHIGSSGRREVRLVFFSDEGLVRYCQLYLKRGVAPEVICTIQSGCDFGKLEKPGGLFEQLVMCSADRPKVWIRDDKGAPVGDSHWCGLASDYPKWRNNSVVAAAYRTTQQQGRIDE